MPAWTKWTRTLAFSCAVSALPGLASAQQLPVSEQRIPENAPANGDGMDTHLFRPALDSKGFFSVNGTDIVAHTDMSFGLVLDYGRNILRTREERRPLAATGTADEACEDPEACEIRTFGTGVDSLVDDSFQGTFSFNIGLFNLAVVGVTLPVILMSGTEAYQIGDNANGLYNTAALDAQKFSTLALHGKMRFTRVDQTVGLAGIIQLGVPISGAPRDLGADPGFWYWPQLAIENHFGFTRRFKVGLNVGYRGHAGENPRFGTNTSMATGQTLSQLAEGELEYGNLATFGLGLSYRLTDAFDLVGETYGSYLLSGDSDSKQKLSQELLGGFKLFVERNSYLMMGAGSRAFSTGFEAADLRLVLGFVFEPSIGDRDGDGYKDDQDACPDEPEDFDGFEDGDGCPEPDNDNDGILDVDDRCPNVPEDFDKDEDEDGCPEAEVEGDADGDKIPDSKDKCPNDPEDFDGFQDKDGCPDPDNDKDGIPDKQDSCPNDPEDFDGFEDKDGCPDPDNDRDQIPDARDKCPNDPETYNGHEDEDGCPDKGLVIVEGSEIQILQKVQFATNSAQILPESNPILDAVAATLKKHPQFLVVEVAGHADERATDAHNLRLTQARARSVVQALAQRGVAAKRLVSQGYGEYCPIDKASNPEAWEKNRRVEFKVVKHEDGLTKVDRGCARARQQNVHPPNVK